MTVPLGRCKACHAPVRWALTVNRRPIPLDPDPSPAGTMLLEEVSGEEIACVVRPGFAPTGAELFVVHFVTCHARGKSGKEITKSALQRTLAKAREGL